MGDKITAGDQAKRLKYIYEYIADLDRELNPDTYKEVERTKLADFYKQELVEQVIQRALADPKTSKKWRFTDGYLQAFNDNPSDLWAFFDEFRANGALAIETYQVIPSEPKYGEFFAEKPSPKIVQVLEPTPTQAGNSKIDALRALIGEQVEKTIQQYELLDEQGLINEIRNTDRTTMTLYRLELPQDVQLIKKTVDRAIKQNKPDLLQELPTADKCVEKLAKAYNLKPYAKSTVWTHFDTYLLTGELGGLIALAGVTDDLQPNGELAKAPSQTELFSNTTMGISTAEITGRHQFFSPMFRGFMGLGESGLYDAINQAYKRGNSVTIPYETKGSSSVYKTKLQTSVDISGVEKDLITDEAKAQRFTARLIKTQGILYLWAMHTNSLTIYNTKVTDMLRLAGYEGRIKPEHYIDITEGIAGLFAIAVTKTDDHYIDLKTGKKVYVGKNEMYGEVVRPIGEVRAIWHKGTDGKPAYIKQLIRLEIAKGMLNPTARRATLVSKALLRLNTLQERQYLQLGSFISELFSQYQDKTIKGEPVSLTLQTLLEYRGLTDPDSLRRVEQTKTYLKQALDKLVDIGHVYKWAVKNGSYEKLTLTGKDLDTVILIYPTTSIQEALKPVINDDDKALTTILTQEVRADGLSETAKHYETNAEAIEAVINNRDTADSLPNTAYNELKTKAYDSGKLGRKRRAN